MLLKEVDKYGAAKKFASEMGKGAVRYTAGAILIEMAMQEMLDGIGWIIDEGGKVTKKPDSSSSSTVTPADPIIYYSPDVAGSHNSESAVHSAVKRVLRVGVIIIHLVHL